jgi:hypothetical protein
MNTYVVSYDLRTPGKNYNELIAALKTYTYWMHVLDSFWVIRSPLGAPQVRDHLARHIDTNDKLIVVQSAHVGAWTGFVAQDTEWLKANL